MIASIFHQGSGLGNQLHRYVMARVLALDKGYEFSMVAPQLFKGKDFMLLDMGKTFNHSFSIEKESGRVIPVSKLSSWNEWDKHCYDPDINFVQDNTIIDGNFEDERYFEHRLPEIRKWLEVEPYDISEDTCVINFRGGEYQYVPELFLPQEYWDRAIQKMRDIGIEHFIVATDDVRLAQKFFPRFECIHNIGENWRMIRYAHYLILANSSFAVLPALLNENAKYILAPRYWNRYNVKRWDYPQGFYKKFSYII